MAVLMEDTSLEAERFLVRQWLNSTPQKVRQQLAGAWTCGCKLAGREVTVLDPLGVTQKILDALTALEIPYLVGGSVASSLYGEPRYTQDTDIEVWPAPAQLEELLVVIESEFYVSKEAALEALRRRSSFNLIHFESQYKIDLFVSKNRPFDRCRAKRRRIPDGFPANFWVSSPDDMVLIKLEWYRSGRQLSDRQWRDVLAILATQGSRLDFEYLRHWAAELQVGDLLESAIQQTEPLG
ncbi:hypothetical protein IV102_26550 [bacterium]|nr:hypothetical protein [bacterium]